MIAKKHSRRLVLFDSHAIIHRAYHALPDFTTSNGIPTGALYGLSTMLIKAVSDLNPDYMIACYDRPEETFRKQAYEAYKGKRQKIEEPLIAQLISSRELFVAFSIPLYEKAGFEADDILGTIAKETKNEKDLEIIIVTGDMDTLQLVDDDRVLVYTLKKGLSDTILYNEERVKERYGFGPELLPDYKGLRGDPSDNIVGVSGIGEKTATELVLKFGSIENIYAALEKGEEELAKAGFKPRIISLLQSGKDEALFSKMLATIRRDVPIDFRMPDKFWRDSLDFEKVQDYFTQMEFRSLSTRLKAALEGRLLPEKEKTVKKAEKIEEESEDKKDKERRVQGIYDPELIKKLGIALWLIDSEITSPKLEDILAYAKTNSLAKAEEKIILDLAHLKLDKVFQEIELPLVPIIQQAESRGILIDKKHLTQLSEKYHEKLKEIEAKIFEMSGGEFNINSPKQLGEVLFDKMKISLKGLRKTAGGARSTRESELEKIREGNPIVEHILEYREYQKLLSTYIDNIPKMLDPEGRLHTTLNQAGTTTGRMSSNNPNLQNIPVRGENGSAIRRAFLAAPGHKLVALDYSQIEMRVLAHFSGDENLVETFEKGKDVHSSVASLVFGVPEKEVTKEMRRQAKVINFGIIYGMGVNALRRNLSTTREEAQKFYDSYFRSLPKIKDYFENIKHGAYRRGYTETYFGRRRYFPGLKSSLPYVRANAERMAMNAPLQGTAADIVKIAMIRVDEEIRRRGWQDKVFLLLQIHDELIYEVAETLAEEAAPVIREKMEKAVDLAVPLTVKYGVGDRWGDID